MAAMDWAVIGHDWAVQMLVEHLRRGHIRHAYLFCGPRGVGRRTLALRLSQALNCPQPFGVGQPCRKCRTCSQIEQMHYADLLVVQAEQEGGTLKVEQVREMRHFLALQPYEGRYRVALLLRFEEAHPSAMNALLKTLEEPAENVILFLTADSPESLLPTIVSRCEVIRLRPVPLEDLRRYLQDTYSLTQEEALSLAHLAGGRPGEAIRFAQQPQLRQRWQFWLGEMHGLLRATRRERFAYMETLSKDRQMMRQVLSVWLSFWRDVYLLAGGISEGLVNIDELAQAEFWSGRLSLPQVLALVRSLEGALVKMEQNVNLRLLGEVIALDLPNVEF